jgi:virginiamycin B lyase
MSLGAAAVLVAACVAAPASAVTVRTFSSGITPASQPTRIAAGADGNLYFTENASNKIGQISLGGTIMEFTSAFAGGPFGITAGSDGLVYYTVSTGGVARFNTGAFPMSPNGLEDITAGPDGNLWFTENAGNNLYRSNVATFADQIAAATAASGPSGIAAGPDGNLWFTESLEDNVRRVTTDGSPVMLAEFP